MITCSLRHLSSPMHIIFSVAEGKYRMCTCRFSPTQCCIERRHVVLLMAMQSELCFRLNSCRFGQLSWLHVKPQLLFKAAQGFVFNMPCPSHDVLADLYSFSCRLQKLDRNCSHGIWCMSKLFLRN